MSPLEEGSRNPSQNYGFLVNYMPSSDSTRITSYSVLNHSEATQPSDPSSSSSAAKQPPARRTNSRILSAILSNANAAGEKQDGQSFVAFKALPVDPARARRTTGSFEEPANNEHWVSNCKQAVEVIVDTIIQATHGAAGSEKTISVQDVPIVNLQDAQRSTTLMAKMEYEFKRLLWLGS